MGSAGKRALFPRVFEVFPGLAEVPAIIPGSAFGAVLAELVDDGCAADDGFEAIGFAFDKSGHLAAVAVTHEGHAIGVEWIVSQGEINAGHHVEIVPTAEIVFVGGSEFGSVIRRAARVGTEDSPTLPDKECGEGVIAIFKGAEGTAVDVDDERHFCGRALRHVEKALDCHCAIRPLN